MIRKLLLFFPVLSCAVMTFAQRPTMELEEAFNALLNVPYVSMKTDFAPSVIEIDGKTDSVGVFKYAGASQLNRQQTEEAGNAAMAILNQVPLRYMINGGNNGSVCALLYATENKDGKFDLLTVSMSGYDGDISILYNTIDKATYDAFRNAKLTMEGNSLAIRTSKEGNSAFNVIIGSEKNEWNPFITGTFNAVIYLLAFYFLPKKWRYVKRAVIAVLIAVPVAVLIRQIIDWLS